MASRLASISKVVRTARSARSFSTFSDSDVVILSAARTPIGSFNGQLSSLTAPQLGTIVIQEAVRRAGIQTADVQDVIMGNVVSAGCGQAPATQAAFRAGIPFNVPSTTINKVCSSGMKSVMFAAQGIQTGQSEVVIAGGMESMSNIPYYLPKARQGYGMGNQEVQDGLLRDGLWDGFDGHHMGICAEQCASDYTISRQEQDNFALESFRRAQQAQKAGLFKAEIVPVTIKGKAGEVVISDDEGPAKLRADKVPTLRPAFKKDGSVTAANSSSINDGAVAFTLASGAWARARGLKPLAKIRSYADAQKRPLEFTTAPALVIPRVLKLGGLTEKDVDYYEINEAFAVVSLANIKLLNLDPQRVNVNGGAVALGHPIGVSGGRIIATLLNVLTQKNARIGVAAICNGGGGASGIAIERL